METTKTKKNTGALWNTEMLLKGIAAKREVQGSAGFTENGLQVYPSLVPESFDSITPHVDPINGGFVLVLPAGRQLALTDVSFNSSIIHRVWVQSVLHSGDIQHEAVFHNIFDPANPTPDQITLPEQRLRRIDTDRLVSVTSHRCLNTYDLPDYSAGTYWARQLPVWNDGDIFLPGTLDPNPNWLKHLAVYLNFSDIPYDVKFPLGDVPGYIVNGVQTYRPNHFNTNNNVKLAEESGPGNFEIHWSETEAIGNNVSVLLRVL